MYLVVARERDGFPQARGILLLGAELQQRGPYNG